MQHNQSSLSYDRERVRQAKARVDRRQQQSKDQPTQDSEGEAFSSPWTGLTSPSSSDFEAISDSELFGHGFPSHPSTSTSAAPLKPSNLGRSLSRQPDASLPPPVSTRRRSFSADPDNGPPRTRARDPSASPFDAGEHSGSGRDAADGDDEYSAFEDGDSSRGRGRTRDRRRREDDPAVKKGLLEDALRSSLATLLSLSAHPQTMSPALSHSSLSSLFGTHSPITGSSNPQRNTLDAFARPPGAPARSTFKFSLFESLAVEEAQAEAEALKYQAREDARQWEEAEEPSSTSEAEVIEHSSDGEVSDDEGTQLAPRPRRLSGAPRAIPIPSTRVRERSNSESQAVTSSAAFSPLQSRALPLGPSTASPPTWSRRRRRKNPPQSSPSPGPATPEERRRARGETSDRSGPQTFLDLVDSSHAFMDVSPARSRGRGGGSSSGTAYNSAAGSALRNPPPTDAPQFSQPWTPEDPLSPTSSFPSSEPVLASSVPTIDLSSGAEMDDSPTRRRTGKAGAAGKSASPDGGDAKPSEGWFGWWGRSIELKVWHLAGIAGILLSLGVGLGAASLFKARPARISLYY